MRIDDVLKGHGIGGGSVYTETPYILSSVIMSNNTLFPGVFTRVSIYGAYTFAIYSYGDKWYMYKFHTEDMTLVAQSVGVLGNILAPPDVNSTGIYIIGDARTLYRLDIDDLSITHSRVMGFSIGRFIKYYDVNESLYTIDYQSNVVYRLDSTTFDTLATSPTISNIYGGIIGGSYLLLTGEFNWWRVDYTTLSLIGEKLPNSSGKRYSDGILEDGLFYMYTNGNHLDRIYIIDEQTFTVVGFVNVSSFVNLAVTDKMLITSKVNSFQINEKAPPYKIHPEGITNFNPTSLSGVYNMTYSKGELVFAGGSPSGSNTRGRVAKVYTNLGYKK